MPSPQSSTFSCYLIGGDSLLIECGEILLSRSHQVLGVITNATRLSQWAASKSIPTIAANSNYGEQLKTTPFDYLFSITHLAIIKDDVLALPLQRTINFHDGPLPAYAGLNTPAWALMNQEKQYGISWHNVTAGVDEGELLKQELFEVSASETSLSINTKCFAAAIESFPVLVDELVAGTTQPVKQDLSKRSYFEKFQRPEAMGFMNWSKTAEELVAFVRALNFGKYPNLLTTPKVLANKQPLCIVEAIAQEQEVSAEPGTVTAIDDSAISIATVDGVLSLTRLSSLAGESVGLAESGICVGDRLDCITAEQQQQLTAQNEKLCRRDETWAKRLASLDPIDIPYSNNDSSAVATTDHYQAIAIEVPGDFIVALGGDSTAYALASAFSVLLARLGRKFEFDLALADTAITTAANLVPGLISDRTAAHVSVDSAADSTAALAIIGGELQQIVEKGAWTSDIVVRFPSLHDAPELRNGTAFPVAFSVGLDSAILGTTVTLAVTDNSAQLYYDSRRLTTEEAQKLASQFSTLLINMAANPTLPCGEIELLSEDEKRNILETWNDTEVAYDNTECLHQLFEQQVKARPNATALVFEDQSVSYAELNQLANNLANELISRGVKPDELVGVNVERSIDLLVSTLGVWKSGAAYVPLDPAFPADRTSYMVGDANMRFVITQTAIQDKLPASDAEVICVDSLSVGKEALANPSVAVASSNLAYVIYTSGSTGNPKGVMVEHRNVVNFFLGMDDRIEHEVPGTWLAVTSLSFDISVLELFWTLTRGFKVIVYKEDRGAQEAAADRKLQRRSMEFGLFMWGNDDAPGSSKYHLMIEGAKYFDENGFDSVWTPERHFSAFGGPYPNPAVTSALQCFWWALSQSGSNQCGHCCNHQKCQNSLWQYCFTTASPYSYRRRLGGGG